MLRMTKTPKSESYTAEVAARIKALRLAKCLTQKQLAELSDIAQNYISEIETGKWSPSINTLLAIAIGLDVDVAELLPPTTWPQPSKPPSKPPKPPSKPSKKKGR